MKTLFQRVDTDTTGWNYKIIDGETYSVYACSPKVFWDIQIYSKLIQILHFHVYILNKTCFLLLDFDLSLVLQHGHIISDVEKNNAHKEHRFCPILYFKLLGNDMGLNLTHNPLHVCDIIFQSLANIFKKISKSITNFFLY